MISSSVIPSLHQHFFFLIKGFYYLRVLSITPGLCIIKMHTATSSEVTNSEQKVKKVKKKVKKKVNYIS